MATTLAIRFPLGRYHATPWDRSVNEGATEWPPSPWRLLRALVATWYTRWPDLPAPELDALLDSLGDPPSYRTPAARPGHTRHYLPDLDHKKGEPGGTDLTLDPFLSVPRSDELLVSWDTDLPAGQREHPGEARRADCPTSAGPTRSAKLACWKAPPSRTRRGGGPAPPAISGSGCWLRLARSAGPLWRSPPWRCAGTGARCPPGSVLVTYASADRQEIRQAPIREIATGRGGQVCRDRRTRRCSRPAGCCSPTRCTGSSAGHWRRGTSTTRGAGSCSGPAGQRPVTGTRTGFRSPRMSSAARRSAHSSCGRQASCEPARSRPSSACPSFPASAAVRETAMATRFTDFPK